MKCMYDFIRKCMGDSEICMNCILNRIRAEMVDPNDYKKYYSTVADTLNIVDKYRSEKEEK